MNTIPNPRRMLALLLALLLALPCVAMAEDIPVIPSHTLTIRYVFADGTQAAETYTTVVAVDDSYSVASPTIADYKPDIPTVSGKMGDSDVTVTVTYAKDPAATRTLTILYLFPDGKQAAKTYTAAVVIGASYAVASPSVEGYAPSIAEVKGVMGDSDVTVSVAYTEITVVTYSLSIVYEYEDGKEAAAPHVELLAEGTPFEVVSPTIRYYTPKKATVSGVMGKKNLAYRVVYKRTRNKVTFKSHGGSGKMAGQTVLCGESARLRKNGYARKGYVFKGWNTKKNGSGKSYADRAVVKFTKDTTLYAQWAKVELKVPESKITVKNASKAVKIAASLRIGGKAAKGEKLIFTMNGIDHRFKTDKKGKAVFTIKPSVLKTLVRGKKYNFTVAYGAVSVKGTLKVK